MGQGRKALVVAGTADSTCSSSIEEDTLCDCGCIYIVYIIFYNIYINLICFILQYYIITGLILNPDG